jgi:hypothetical protein
MSTAINRRTTIAALVAVSGLAVVAPPAVAGGDDVVRRGSCSGSTSWKIKAGHEDGRIEVEGEIDSNKSGQTWRWRLKHNGTLSAKGTRTTQPPSGSFEVRRLVVDQKGPDRLVFRATNPKTDEVCRGVLNF